MSPAELKTLIESDQQALIAASASRWRDCAVRASAIAPAIRQTVDGGIVQKIASMNGVWAKITLARESAETPDAVKGICITFLDWVRKDWRIDFDLPEVEAMLAGLIQAGVVTQGEADEIDAAANTPQSFTPAECRFAMTGV